MITTYQDFLSNNYVAEITDFLNPNNDIWEYNSNTSIPNGLFNSKTTKDSDQYVHLFLGMRQGPTFYILDDLCKKIKEIRNVSFVRVKANLLYQDLTSKDYHHIPHRDKEETGFVSFIYYLNDSDGDTIFFDNNLKIIKRIQPKQNSLIEFPSNVLHASSSPINHNSRLVINFVCKIL